MNSSLSYTLSSSTVSVPYGQGEKPKAAPASLLATAAVQTKSGWVGQIAVDAVIVWESKPYKSADKAVAAANTRITAGLRRLLADDDL